MRGKAILFPPHHGFTYWFPPDHIKKQLEDVRSRIGKIITLQQKAICRMCGKGIPAGKEAMPDYFLYDEMRQGISGYIHPQKCIPLITAILGNMVNGVFVEEWRVGTDNTLFVEGFHSHTLEEAKEDDVRHLLDGYWNGLYELAYIELDGIRHPEPVYSHLFTKTTIRR